MTWHGAGLKNNYPSEEILSFWVSSVFYYLLRDQTDSNCQSLCPGLRHTASRTLEEEAGLEPALSVLKHCQIVTQYIQAAGATWTCLIWWAPHFPKWHAVYYDTVYGVFQNEAIPRITAKMCNYFRETWKDFTDENPNSLQFKKCMKCMCRM